MKQITLVFLFTFLAFNVSSQYSWESIEFNPIEGFPGRGIDVKNENKEYKMSGPYPIGFEFEFFGKKYKEFYLSRNGYITFSSNMPHKPSRCTGDEDYVNILGASPDKPNNLIAFCWTAHETYDIYHEWGWEAVKMEYLTIGNSPNRMLVVNLDSLFKYDYSRNTAQLILYENNNHIEFHLTDASISVSGIGQDAWYGGWYQLDLMLENEQGNIAILPEYENRNRSDTHLVNKAFRFIPCSLSPEQDILPDIYSECPISPDAPKAISSCGEVVEGIPDVTFPIATLGETILTWKYDNGGKIYTQNQKVTINDNEAPIPATILEEVHSECSVSELTLPIAYDNCSGEIVGVTDTKLPLTTQGETIIIWTYDDGNGNISAQEQKVVINDNEAPIPSIKLEELISECTIYEMASPIAYDNCSGEVVGVTDTKFPLTTQGETIITWTYDDTNGNISTQEQTVYINYIDNSITQNGITLSTTLDGYQYQWIDCNNDNQSIPNETNKDYTISSSGRYAVIISNGECMTISDCIEITIPLEEKLVTVFPNPTTDILYVYQETASDMQIFLYNTKGQLFISKNIKKNSAMLELDHLAPDVYLVKVVFGNNKETLKVIKL